MLVTRVVVGTRGGDRACVEGFCINAIYLRVQLIHLSTLLLADYHRIQFLMAIIARASCAFVYVSSAGLMSLCQIRAAWYACLGWDERQGPSRLTRHATIRLGRGAK